MKRITYIYLLIILFTALSAEPTAREVLGVYGAVALETVLCLAVWAIVWMRLYNGGKVRPEFSILSVLPMLCYLGLTATRDDTHIIFSQTIWVRVYFLLWIVSAVILILSLRRTSRDGEPRKWTRDATLLITSSLVIFYNLLMVAFTYAWLMTPQ